MAERGKIFKDAPIIAPNRSWFDMSYENTFSMNIGECVPAAFFECLPGDHFKAKTSSLTRFAPMLAPVLTSVNQFSYHMFVRLRDIWTQFDKFITNNDQRRTWQQQSEFVPPTMPYFKPRNLLFDKLAAPASFTITPDSTKNIYSHGAPRRGYMLILQRSYDSVSGKYYVKVQCLSSTLSFNVWNAFVDTTADRRDYLVLHFKANTTEFRYDKDPQYMLNPFCPGSLMDYLGVDISGLYTTQDDWYYQAFDQLGVGITDPLDFTGEAPGKPFYGEVETVTFEKLDGLDFGDDNINVGFSSLKEFINTHAIYSMSYITYADGKTAQVSTKGSYKIYKRLTDTYETGTLIDGWFGTFPEDPLSVLPLRAYRFIYDEYFRDQNYIEVNPITDFTRDGDEFASVDFDSADECNQVIDYLSCFRKAWEHDPYTSALPGPQRGDAVHFLPSDFSGRVTYGDAVVHSDHPAQGGSNASQLGTTVIFKDDGSIATLRGGGTNSSGSMHYMEVDLNLDAATIENFRWANSMQKYLEKKARTGGRYYEYLLGIWNKSVDDSKLNRPIYISGDRTPIQVSEVLQTSASDFQTDQPLGDMAGRAIALGKDDFIEYEVPDYGFFIELTAVVPRVAYQQGVAPHFTRENYLDYPLPDFAQLGEEYIKRKDLWYIADSNSDNVAFGYTPRYSQWKYKRNEIHGEFKDTLDFWHFGRKFDSAPVNGKKFLEVNPDYRQFAVNTSNYQHVYCQMWHDVQMNRALPEYGIPVL